MVSVEGGREVAGFVASGDSAWASESDTTGVVGFKVLGLCVTKVIFCPTVASGFSPRPAGLGRPRGHLNALVARQ